MKLTDLKIGKRYNISYTKGDKDSNYVGVGKLVSLNPDGYPEGTLEFSLPGEVNEGYFSIGDIIGEAPGDYDYLLKDMPSLVSPSYDKLNENKHRLLHAVLCVYAKHHLNRNEIGWNQLSDILCNAICEEIGDNDYCKWMDMMRMENSGGET